MSEINSFSDYASRSFKNINAHAITKAVKSFADDYNYDWKRQQTGVRRGSLEEKNEKVGSKDKDEDEDKYSR